MVFCDVSTSSLLKLGYFKASNIPEETKAPKMNFDQSSGSIPRASYKLRRKLWPIVEVLCYFCRQ